MDKIKIITNICLIIALYYLTYHTYLGLLNPIPALGDSWDYHIPISQSILNGSFLNPSHFTKEQYFAQLNPGSSEAINSLFIILHIPLTISNLFAAIVLFFCLWKLALIFRLKNYFALLFALTFSTLNVIIRWLNSVSIDIWVAVFFTLAIILLEDPKKNIRYFAKVGFVLGMLVGSKYSGLTILLILLIAYGKKLLEAVTISRFIVLLMPFSIFGLFWYIRNYLAVGNPLWPFCLISLPCKAIYYNNHVQMWNAAISHPIVMLDALFSEYKLWSFSLLIPFFVIYLILRKKLTFSSKISVLCFIGVANLIFFSIYPTSYEPWVMVSSFRYSYSIFIPLLVAVFLLAEKYQKEKLIGYFAIANMINVLSMAYYPKLILIYLPLSLLAFYYINKKWA